MCRAAGAVAPLNANVWAVCSQEAPGAPENTGPQRQGAGSQLEVPGLPGPNRRPLWPDAALGLSSNVPVPLHPQSKAGAAPQTDGVGSSHGIETLP